jgi:hypothetical protein
MGHLARTLTEPFNDAAIPYGAGVLAAVAERELSRPPAPAGRPVE